MYKRILRLTPARAFLITLVFGLLLALIAYQAERRSRAAEFDRLAAEAVDRINARLSQHVALLTATKAYFETTNQIANRREFAQFTGNLQLADDYDGIQGIGFAMLTPVGQEPFAARVIEQNYGVRRQIHPETDQQFRTPITLLEPEADRNFVAIGYDMFADPVRRDAMVAAALSGEAQATAPVSLVQEITPHKQMGFLIYLPTVLASTDGYRVQDEANRLDGFIYAPFRADDFIHAALEEGASMPIRLRVRDRAMPETALYESSGGIEGDHILPALSTQETLEVYGREWIVDVAATVDYELETKGLASAFMGLMTLLLAWASSSAVTAYRRRADIANEAALAAEEQAEAREFILQEMKHRIKNHIARIQAISRQTVRGSDNLEEFDKTFNARLASMAVAQDVLSQGGISAAPLGAIVTKELEQILTEEEVAAIVSGPEVMLGARQSHSIGLIIHELMTNALKHGGVSGTEPELSVTWQLNDGVDPVTVRLFWKESGGKTDYQNGGHSGFGSRLLDVCVRELGGDFSREMEADGLRITIRFPVRPTNLPS
ncbi:CHASE domain-containing protein [Paracoccaceae bacterium GXU_MW_L88]